MPVPHTHSIADYSSLGAAGDCSECDGKVTSLTLAYQCSVTDASIVVYQEKHNEAWVPFSFDGGFRLTYRHVPWYITSMWIHPESHPGEYLRARFLEPLALTAADLARGCKMPRSRVSEILTGKRAISIDTAKRLAAFFRMEAEAWVALQSDWDLQQAELHDSIEPLDPPGFLLGPLGATRIPVRRRASPPHLRLPGGRERGAMGHGEDGTSGRQEHEEIRYADGTRALVATRR